MSRRLLFVEVCLVLKNIRISSLQLGLWDCVFMYKSSILFESFYYHHRANRVAIIWSTVDLTNTARMAQNSSSLRTTQSAKRLSRLKPWVKDERENEDLFCECIEMSRRNDIS